MDDNNDKRKVDGYVTLNKSLQESINKSLPNTEFINGINKGLIDAIKPITDYNLSIAKIYSDEILKTQKMINAMIEPITEITRKIIELYEPIMNNTISNITKIFEKIDWSKFDLIYKEIAIKYLSNGFYPYRNTEIKYEELLNTNNKNKQLKIIKQGIRLDIKKNKKVLLLTYPEYKKEMSFYTPEEFQKFLSVENDVKFICAFQTLFYCGLRNGELRGLTWNDINFRKSCLSVNKNITKTPDPITGKPYTVSSPKTMSSYRTIPIPNFLLEYYKDLYDDCSSYYNFNDNWYVFGNIDPLPETTLRDRKTKNAFKAGVKDIRVHDFRHSCASLLIDSGANITLVAKYLGHSKIDETLNTYSHMYQNRLENIVQIIEVQNTKLLESKQKELPEPKETIIDYEDAEYYDYDKNLDNKKEDDLVL